MFKIAKTAKTTADGIVGGVEQKIGISAKWIPSSARMALFENLTEASAKVESDARKDSEKLREVYGHQADVILGLVESWDVADADGNPIPLTREAVTDAIDGCPGLFGIVVEAAGAATSIEARAKN